jgi:hypothetical protein
MLGGYTGDEQNIGNTADTAAVLLGMHLHKF